MQTRDASHTPVRVLVVDDHPALRAGLGGLLEQEPGFECLGTISGERELFRALEDERPDVILLDYALAGSDGLSVCFRLKQRPHPPGVVLYSAYADELFAVPAAVAQADAIVPKSAPVEVVLDAVRAVMTGGSGIQGLDPEAVHAVSSRLGAADLPVLGMLFARESVGAIAATLGMTPKEVRSRALRIIGEMQATDRIGPPATVPALG